MMQVEVADWPVLQDPGSDRLVLRDGTIALCRAAVAEDDNALQPFFYELKPESQHTRFFTASEPPAVLIRQFCVEPRMHGKGLATALLERLAATATTDVARRNERELLESFDSYRRGTGN